MDNHPIPQDITGFQFKLIGKMTIRQFIYVAIGGVIAWLMFFIIEPPSIIKWPVSVIALGLGTMIAFVPIDGRPMDTMLRNFINALMSPTQFIYQKEGGPTGNASVSPAAIAQASNLATNQAQVMKRSTSKRNPTHLPCATANINPNCKCEQSTSFAKHGATSPTACCIP